MYPVLKLVDSPDVGATVRLDLNDEDAWPAADDFDLGAPQLLGDPDGVGSLYGNRTLKFTWVIQGPKPAALNRQSALAREVMREGGSWLLFQLTSTAQPVWFRTKRSNPGAVSLSQVYTGEGAQDSWRVSVQLEAEPFAYGAREEFTFTVPTDPATTNAMTAVLPAIKGDAPAPLVMGLPAPPTSTFYTPELSLIAVDSAWPGAQWFPIKSTTASTWTAADPDTTIGASSATVSFSFEASMVTRLAGKVMPKFAGKYRVMVQVAASGAGIMVANAGPPLSADQYTFNTAAAAFVDLGVQVFPNRNLPGSRPYVLGTPSTPTVNIALKRTSGTATATVYGVLLVPVDLPLDQVGDPWHVELEQVFGTEGNGLRLNGEAERRERVVGGAYYPGPGTQTLVGGFPKVTPGATNVLHYLPHKRNNEPYQYAIATETVTFTCSYRPRWLGLAAS